MNPTDRGRKLLERCALFSSLDEKARRTSAAFAQPRNFKASEAICRLGDDGDSMMAVVVGAVRISLPTTKGKEVILADLRAGELFGEIAMLALALILLRLMPQGITGQFFRNST